MAVNGKPPYPAVGEVALCSLLAGLISVTYATGCIRFSPRYIRLAQMQIPGFEYLDDFASLPWCLLVISAAQVAAGALSLLLPGLARRALAFLAVAAGVASLLVKAELLRIFTNYTMDVAGYGSSTINPVLIGEGSVIGFFLSTVLKRFVAVVRGEE